MSVEVRFVEGPLGPAEPWRPSGAGAVVAFEGVVRPTEEGRLLRGLVYEVYEPMARREMRRLAEEMLGSFGLLALRVSHSVGYVPVGACSFRLETAGRHRSEALAAQEAFIDAMKRSIPIWKHPRWREDATRVGGPEAAREPA